MAWAPRCSTRPLGCRPTAYEREAQPGAGSSDLSLEVGTVGDHDRFERLCPNENDFVAAAKMLLLRLGVRFQCLVDILELEMALQHVFLDVEDKEEVDDAVGHAANHSALRH